MTDGRERGLQSSHPVRRGDRWVAPVSDRFDEGANVGIDRAPEIPAPVEETRMPFAGSRLLMTEQAHRFHDILDFDPALRSADFEDNRPGMRIRTVPTAQQSPHGTGCEPK